MRASLNEIDKIQVHYKKYLFDLFEELFEFHYKDKSADIRFSEIGINSILAIELRNILQSHLMNNINLPPTVIFDYPSTNRLSKYIATLINKYLR